MNVDKNYCKTLSYLPNRSLTNIFFIYNLQSWWKVEENWLCVVGNTIHIEYTWQIPPGVLSARSGPSRLLLLLAAACCCCLLRLAVVLFACALRLFVSRIIHSVIFRRWKCLLFRREFLWNIIDNGRQRHGPRAYPVARPASVSGKNFSTGDNGRQRHGPRACPVARPGPVSGKKLYEDPFLERNLLTLNRLFLGKSPLPLSFNEIKFDCQAHFVSTAYNPHVTSLATLSS